MIFKKQIHNWNLTEKIIANIYEPKNIKSLKQLLKNNKNLYFIKTGECGYGDKSLSTKTNNQLSLKNFNRIIKFNQKIGVIEVECGINLYKLSEYLFKRNYFLFNVPGGLQVSLGGAISGNVHGRFSSKNFSTFGDNIKSIKVLDKNLKIKKLDRNTKKFYNYIGGFGIFGVVLSAELYVRKIENFSYRREKKYIQNINLFKNFFNQNESFYGFINQFRNEGFEGLFYSSQGLNLKKKQSTFKNNNKVKKNIFINILSLFLNKFTLRIFVNLIFLFNMICKKNYSKNIDFEDTIYHSKNIYHLPKFFKKGMLEIQISLKEKNFEKTYKKLMYLFRSYKIFPYFFIIKKMSISKKIYFNSFPANKLCISLGFEKKIFINEHKFFKKIFNYISKNNIDYYKSKDEIFDKFSKKKIKKKLRNKINNKFTNLYLEKNVK